MVGAHFLDAFTRAILGSRFCSRVGWSNERVAWDKIAFVVRNGQLSHKYARTREARTKVQAAAANDFVARWVILTAGGRFVSSVALAARRQDRPSMAL